MRESGRKTTSFLVSLRIAVKSNNLDQRIQLINHLGLERHVHASIFHLFI